MTNAFTPSSDSHIEKKYSVSTLEHKVQNKVTLQEELGWAAEPKRAVVCFPAGMTDGLGGPLLHDILPGLLSLPIEILILGKGSAAYGTLFTKLAKEHGHRIAILPEDERSIHMMYAASDMALFLADTRNLKEVQHCLTYGVVPIAPEGSPHLENYDPVQETGNAFLYESPGKWLTFAALVRAMETHKFPFDWRTIQRHSMESVRAK